jgi:hypothetical protein
MCSINNKKLINKKSKKNAEICSSVGKSLFLNKRAYKPVNLMGFSFRGCSNITLEIMLNFSNLID